MSEKFIFDVDGTLTPSRGLIDLEFKSFFNSFCLMHDVYLVSGSDRPKTIEQLGEHTYNLCKRVYNCSGSEVYEQDKLIRANVWNPPKKLYDIMNSWLEASKFPLRMGNHIEERRGMINFSIVGRNCSAGERGLYVKYDKENRERETIAYIINSEFDDITATVGGETGIDIAPTGWDKSQILTDFSYYDTITFFGDRMDEKGNDFPLARALVNGSYWKGKAVLVKDWRDTWEKLKEII